MPKMPERCRRGDASHIADIVRGFANTVQRAKTLHKVSQSYSSLAKYQWYQTRMSDIEKDRTRNFLRTHEREEA
jgi:hypothetical protein